MIDVDRKKGSIQRIQDMTAEVVVAAPQYGDDVYKTSKIHDACEVG